MPVAPEGCTVARFTTATADAVFVDVLGPPSLSSSSRRCGPCMFIALNARTIRLEDGNDVMLPEEIPSPMDNGGREIVDVVEGIESEPVEPGGSVESGKLFVDIGLDDGRSCVEPRCTEEDGTSLEGAELDGVETCVES